MVQVKGSAVVARVRFVRERYGEDAYRALKRELDAADREVLEGRVLPHEWVPFDLWVRLMTAIDERFGQGDLALCQEMGRYSAQLNLPTLYRIFYQLGSTRYIIKRAARLWEVHYSSGRLEVDEGGGPGVLTLRIEGFATPHRAHCLSVLGWAERSAQMSGSTVRSAREVACRTEGADACALQLILEGQ